MEVQLAPDPPIAGGECLLDLKGAAPFPDSFLATGKVGKRSGTERENSGPDLSGRSGAGWAPDRRTACPER